MFTFRLQSLLDARIACEERAVSEVSTAVGRLIREQEILQGLRNERSVLGGQLKALQGSPTRALDLSLLIAHLWRCHDHEKEQENLIEGIQRDLDMKREELLAAVKDRKIMENLKMRHLEQYRDHIDDMERKDLDEIAITRFGRSER